MAQSHTLHVLFKRRTATGIKEFLNLFVLCIGELVSCLKGIKRGGGGGGCNGLEKEVVVSVLVNLLQAVGNKTD